MIATIVKHQWFSGSPLPLNEWFGRNHWYQWFFNGFWSINHWPRCFFSLATIGLDGFAMVFGLATIGLDGFSMVANHWSNDGMVTIHRYGLLQCLQKWNPALRTWSQNIFNGRIETFRVKWGPIFKLLRTLSHYFNQSSFKNRIFTTNDISQQ